MTFVLPLFSWETHAETLIIVVSVQITKKTRTNITEIHTLNNARVQTELTINIFTHSYNKPKKWKQKEILWFF